MLEFTAAEYAGKTVESVKFIPRDAGKDIPFLCSIRFTDGATLNLSAYQVDGIVTPIPDPSGMSMFEFPARWLTPTTQAP